MLADVHIWYLSGEMPRCLLSSPHRSLEYCLLWAPLILPMLWREQSAQGSPLPPNIIIWSGLICTAMYCTRKTNGQRWSQFQHHKSCSEGCGEYPAHFELINANVSIAIWPQSKTLQISSVFIYLVYIIVVILYSDFFFILQLQIMSLSVYSSLPQITGINSRSFGLLSLRQRQIQLFIYFNLGQLP